MSESHVDCSLITLAIWIQFDNSISTRDRLDEIGHWVAWIILGEPVVAYELGGFGFG